MRDDDENIVMEDEADVSTEDMASGLEDADTPDDSMLEDDGPPEPAAAKKTPVKKKPAAKKKAKKKAAKKKNADPDQPEPVPIGEIPDKNMTVLEGLYKGHKLFQINVGGKRRMSFGLGKAKLLLEAWESGDLSAWIKKQEALSGGMEDE